MKQQFEVSTSSHACLVNITSQITRIISQSNIKEGICCVFIPHTTAGITINENADPTVQSDILNTMDKIVPWENDYDHGEGNAAAHVKTSIFGSSQTIIISGGRPQLGVWQAIYLAEFDGPRRRQVWVQIIAE